MDIDVGDDARKICKYWLKDGKGILADNSGFNRHNLSRIEKVIQSNYTLLLDSFNEYCKNHKN